MGELLALAPPIYPSMEGRAVADNAALKDLIETNSDRVIHIQCPSDADTASEMVRQYLEANKRNFEQMLLSFRFNAHDIRFNNMRSALLTFLSLIHFNRIRTMNSTIEDVARDFGQSKAWSPDDLYFHWECHRNVGCKL